jgi:hypothetical protein
VLECKKTLARTCGGLNVWAPGGGGGKRPRPWRRGVRGSNVRSWEVVSVVMSSPVGGSVRCSVQGGQLSKLQGGSCPVGRPVAQTRAARAALPAAPGLARWGREHSSRTPPPQPPPPQGPLPFLLFSLLPSLPGRVRVASQPPPPNPCARRRARPPITRLKPRRVASCAPGWVTAGRDRRNGEGGGGAC